MGRRFAFLFASILVAGFGSAVFAHGDAAWIMKGQYYDILNNHPEVHCCGPSDCQQWPEEDVTAEADGYHLKSTGEVIPYSKTYFTEPNQLHVSKYWRCHNYEMTEAGKNRNDTFGTLPSTMYKTRCFFAPGGAV